MPAGQDPLHEFRQRLLGAALQEGDHHRQVDPGDELHPTRIEEPGASLRTAAAEEIDEPLTDVHASADYRRDLAGVLGRRALAEAAARAA